MAQRHAYSNTEITTAREREREGNFSFSGMTVRCSRCGLPVELTVSELGEDGTMPSDYLCANCDSGIYPDPRELGD